MCPLRFILVFLSAALAGYLAWRAARSPAASPVDAAGGEGARDDGASGKVRRFDIGKAVGNGFWVFVDMASGRYLWRNLGASASASASANKGR